MVVKEKAPFAIAGGAFFFYVADFFCFFQNVLIHSFTASFASFVGVMFSRSASSA